MVVEAAKKINDEYSAYYKELLSKGRFPMKETPLGFWGYSLGDEIVELFTILNLGQYTHFLDLGSGDGKVVNLAALFTKATGIEADKELIEKSNAVKQKFGLSKASFVLGDFMQHDLSQYDILFIYPDKRMHEIEEKLIKEMKGILIFQGLHFHPLRLKKVKEFYAGTNLITIYGSG